MVKVKCTDDIPQFCDHLDKFIVLSPDPGMQALSSIARELREGENTVI